MNFRTRNTYRADLALGLSNGDYGLANAMMRTGLLDVALDGRQAVFGGEHGNTGRPLSGGALRQRMKRLAADGSTSAPEPEHRCDWVRLKANEPCPVCGDSIPF